jgi:hypothetical protein
MCSSRSDASHRTARRRTRRYEQLVL